MYPKWKYKRHETLPYLSKLIHSEAHELKVGSDWHDTPAGWHESCPAADGFGPEIQSPEIEEIKKRGRPKKVEAPA